MIPKIIHYCWFGGKEKPKLVQDCFISWSKYLPDYEIKEWNENNSDLSHPFVNEAYRLKKWAFVADYIRLVKVYEFGGIYLDTDMMVLKSFTELLENNCFFGAEDKNYVSCGIIGAIKENTIIHDFLKLYDSIEMNHKIKFDLITMPVLVTAEFRTRFNFTADFGERVNFEEVIIYETAYFYPLPNCLKDDVLNYINYVTPETIAVHLWSASWVEYDAFYYLEKKLFLKALDQIIKKVFVKKECSVGYFKKIIKLFLKVI